MSAPQYPAKDYARNRGEYDRFWSARWRRSHTYSAQTKLKRFKAFVKPGSRIGAGAPTVFDQGFGLGLMLFCFPKASKLAGWELSPTAVDAARVKAFRLGYSNTDFRVFEPSNEIPQGWREAFDVVISSHVLEHLTDPLAGMRSLGSLLKPGGFGCFVVPINEKPGEDENHFSHFCVADFLALTKSAGFEIIDYHECDRLWHVLCPLAYSLQRRPNRAKGVVSKLVNVLTAFLPHFALAAVDEILKLGGFPTRQVFVLCRKPL